jgi:hypothetical protein
MAEREIRINDKIRGIYDNLKNIKRLLKESEGHLNKQVFSRKIQEHNEENLRFIQELNRQGVTNEEIQRRLQEVPRLMHDGYSKNSTSRGLPSTMNTTRPTQDWRRIIEFVQPEHGLPYEFQLPENRPHSALLEGPRE